VGDAGAGIVEPLDRQRERRGDGVVQTVERQPFGDAEMQAAERDRLERQNILAGHDRVGRSAGGNAARERTDGVEGVAERKRTVGRHALLARLEADDAAQRRRNSHRAAGVGADRDLAHAVGDGDGRTGRRTAGHAAAVSRIARRAEMRIGTDARKGELGHVGFRDDDGAGLAKPAHDRRIGFGRSRFFGENLRAGARRLAGNVEQILDADDGAVEWAECRGALRPRVGGVGRSTRLGGIDREAGARAFALGIGDARQRLFETVARRALRHDQAFTTIAGFKSFSDGAPTCCMATISSVRNISSTRSTPAWPKAPSPHR